MYLQYTYPLFLIIVALVTYIIYLHVYNKIETKYVVECTFLCRHRENGESKVLIQYESCKFLVDYEYCHFTDNGFFVDFKAIKNAL